MPLWNRKSKNAEEPSTTMSEDIQNPPADESSKAGGNSNAEIENLRSEKNALYEKLARAQADFQNSRKRLEADLEARVQYQLSKLIES